MAFKLHQSFYECLTKDSQNLISPDRVPKMESADKFYSPSLRIWPQKIQQEEGRDKRGVISFLQKLTK